MTKTEIKNIFASSKEKNITIVDVRSYMEREQVSIPYTLHIPIDELEARIDELKSFEKVYFFCKAGVRAEYASQIAKNCGISAISIKNSIFEIVEAIT